MNAIFSFPNLIGMPLRWFVGNPKHSNEAGVGNFQTWQGGWLSAYRSWFTSGSTPCWHNHCSTLPQRDNEFVVWYCCVCLVLWICVVWLCLRMGNPDYNSEVVHLSSMDKTQPFLVLHTQRKQFILACQGTKELKDVSFNLEIYKIDLTQQYRALISLVFREATGS